MGFKLISFDYFRLKKIKLILNKVNAQASSMARLTDEELRQKTIEFRERYLSGESLDSLLPEAFAVAREADKRVLGMYPYDEQVMGAIVLHQGNVAEMKTGEGKTLVATMALYLNAISGKGAILVTNNSYLARRDGEEMCPLYQFLGLSTAIGLSEDPSQTLTVDEKKQIYNSDVIYTTNSALGFDYLIDNLADAPEKKFLRDFNYCIIDEADAVLLDAAQMPLVISGAPRVQSNLYKICDNFVYTLVDETYYHLDIEKQEVWLTQKGIDEARKFFAMEHLYVSDDNHRELIRHITLALRAHKLYTKNKDYVIESGEVKLIDKREGRILEMTKMQAGQHQALEAKEGLETSQEMRAIASITYQNLFFLFENYGGMTGTGKSDEDEFIEIYDKEVIQIPTHNKLRRKDLPDRIFTTLPEKIYASIELVKELHGKGQPVLLVTGSVKMSEVYSEILLFEGIPHNILNAQSESKEARIIAEAGREGSVTVATMMAGRGTDIKLTAESKKLGGLAVVITERMESKRMDLQIRGRSGRQGDPGFSQFFVSLEDDLLTEWGRTSLQDYYKKQVTHRNVTNPEELLSTYFQNSVEQAQHASDAYGRNSRKDTLQFDDSLKLQRQIVYSERNRILSNESSQYDLREIIVSFVDETLQKYGKQISQKDLLDIILTNISYDFDNSFFKQEDYTISEARQLILELVDKQLDEKDSLLKTDKQKESFKRIVLLKAIDECWIEEVDYLQQLRVLVSSRRAAQRNPVFEYHKEALKAFDNMLSDIKLFVVRNTLLSDVTIEKGEKMNIYFA